jgi:hypothetical protein
MIFLPLLTAANIGWTPGVAQSDAQRDKMVAAAFPVLFYQHT